MAAASRTPSSEGKGPVPMGLAIRRFLPPRDLEAVLKLQYDADLPDPMTRRMANACWKLHDPEEGRSFVERLYVAVDAESDAPKAFIRFVSGKHSTLVASLCVHPSVQRIGIGSCLLSRLVQSSDARIKRPSIIAGVREGCIGALKAMKRCGIPCVGFSRGWFRSPDEGACVFHLWQGEGPCPRDRRTKALAPWNARPV